MEPIDAEVVPEKIILQYKDHHHTFRLAPPEAKPSVAAPTISVQTATEQWWAEMGFEMNGRAQVTLKTMTMAVADIMQRAQFDDAPTPAPTTASVLDRLRERVQQMADAYKATSIGPLEVAGVNRMHVGIFALIDKEKEAAKS